MVLLHIAQVALLAVVAATVPGVFNICDYGGVGDGVTLNTDAFSRAISAANVYYLATGLQGNVYVPDGVFYSGQIRLHSGITLVVSCGARLLASSDAADYPPDQTQWAFVFADSTENLRITGGGVLDGNFMKYIAGFDAVQNKFVTAGWPNCSGECRPRLAILQNSNYIEVDNVTFTGSADWTFQLLNCTFAHVHNWTQVGDERFPNNDGIDIDSSSHVLLEYSSIDTADDGVCIKGSTPGGVVRNVTVRHCTIRSRSSAIKYGSNCPIPMFDHLFEDIYIHDSNRGLALQARDGGTLSNITFRRININTTRFWPWSWWGDGSPIYISTMIRQPGDPACSVFNVTFEDITAISQNGVVLSGIAPGNVLHDVVLRRVNVTIDRTASMNYSASLMSGPSIEYDPTSGVLPHTRVNTSGWMAGVFAEGVVGLVLDTVNVVFNNANWQSYWGTCCVNTSTAGAPVSVLGGVCEPPLAANIGRNLRR